MSKILILVAGAAGYVAGARAGRDRYDEIVDKAQGAWTNPKLRKAAEDAKTAAAPQSPVLKGTPGDTSGNAAAGDSGKYAATK